MKIGDEDGRYFSLQQSLFILGWILYAKKDPLRPNRWPEFRELFKCHHPRWWLSKYLRAFRGNLSILKNFYFYKCHIKKIEASVMLSFPGQICVRVHKGYKIFDFLKRVVVKVFDKDADASMIFEEVEQLRHISQIPFAPTLRRWNLEEKWYEENYVDGAYERAPIPLSSGEVIDKFDRHLAPHIMFLMTFHETKYRFSLDYGQEIIQHSNMIQLTNVQLFGKNAETVKKFIDFILEILEKEGDHSVQLAFTHGDFCPANMLNVGSGMIIVDWESAKDRSLLFDLYSYFFHRPAGRKVPIQNTIWEINEALSRMNSRAPTEIREFLIIFSELERVYRCIFYLEFIHRLAERLGTDTRLDIWRYINNYITAFSAYEEHVKQN